MYSTHPHDEVIDAFSLYLINPSCQNLIEAGFSDRIVSLIEVFEASCEDEIDISTLAYRLRMPETVCKKMVEMYKSQTQKVE